MHWVWNWSGECIGYLDGDHLRSVDGRHIGTVQGMEIYDRHGVYLGEVNAESRLSFFWSKKNWYGTRFNPRPPCDACRPPGNRPAEPMPPGSRDFADPGPA